MNAETFLEQFETFAEAPNGVEQLRAMILQLAVQGKLVPQNPSDEPVDKLIEGIEEFKQQATGRKTIITRLSHTSLGFPLPVGWIAVSFGDIVLNRDGERIPVSRDIREGRQGPYDYYGASGVIDCIDDFLFNKPLLLIGEDGANLINRSTPIAFIASGKYWVNNHAHVLDGISFDFLRYISLFINAIDLKPYVTGTAQPKMNQAKMNSIPVALPPLAEQKRIVAKVDQLLALCDELAARQEARRVARTQLVGATLDRLVSTHSPADLAPHVHRLRTHFDHLFDTPTTIPQLRQTILQLAVQGQLVPQDPNDEPASVLCLKIEDERGKLIEQREITASATDAEWPNGALPFVLPSGWEWIRLGELGGFLGGGTPSKERAEYWDGDIPWVSPKDMKRPYINDSIDHVSLLGAENCSGKMIPSGSLLMVVRGMILAHSFPVAITTRDVVINQDMKALRLSLPQIGEYLLLCCTASKHRMLNHVERSSHGTCRLPTDVVANFPIPLPPLAEQRRIIAKVTELMSLCDALESQLKTAESASTQLLSAAVHHLLEPESTSAEAGNSCHK